MSVVQHIETPTEGVAEVYNNAKNYFGHIPNLVKALGSNQKLCTSITHFMIQSLGEGRINWALKELIILKTLRVMGSHYSYGAHEKIARSLGVSEEKLGDLNNSVWQESPHYSEAERLVFQLVTRIGIDANDVPSSLWQKLREHFDNGQLVEINAVITTFLMIGRVGDALGVSDPILFTKAIA